MDWCTIESDPGVFSELIEKIGIKDVQVEELYALDEELLNRLKPVHGLIFLFKWRKETNPRPVTHAEDVYFAQQTVSNACGTQAILNILLNCPEVDLGAELTNFKEFTMWLPPDVRGESIGQQETVRRVHNSFRRPEPFVMESKQATDDDDVFHFVGYVPINGQLYELDGLKAGPIALGAVTPADWLTVAKTAIEQRIQRYHEDAKASESQEIRFNLMAVCKKKSVTLEEAKEKKVAALAALAADAEASSRTVLEMEIKDLDQQLADEQKKLADWKSENVRRRHDYIPFIFNLLTSLAQKGQLGELQEKANKSAADKTEARAKKAAKATPASS